MGKELAGDSFQEAHGRSRTGVAQEGDSATCRLNCRTRDRLGVTASVGAAAAEDFEIGGRGRDRAPRDNWKSIQTSLVNRYGALRGQLPIPAICQE
jgi:hypothetical protein